MDVAGEDAPGRVGGAHEEVGDDVPVAGELRRLGPLRDPLIVRRRGGGPEELLVPLVLRTLGCGAKQRNPMCQDGSPTDMFLCVRTEHPIRVGRRPCQVCPGGTL